MESSAALLRASSGLEKLMAGGDKNGPLQSSVVAQVSAALYYQANVIAKLTESQKFKQVFRDTIFNQIMKDFGEYIDAKARSNPKTLHHVYEWKKLGVESGRLFQLTMSHSEGTSFKIKYQFNPSKTAVPSSKGKRRHVFVNKASVMEAGLPLIIRPRHAQRLVFEIDGRTVFMPKGASVNIRRAGGVRATNQFHLAYARFFNSNLVSESIKKSGFQKIFNSASAKALRIPSSIRKVKYEFNANTVRTEADAAVMAAFGGVLI